MQVSLPTVLLSRPQDLNYHSPEKQVPRANHQMIYLSIQSGEDDTGTPLQYVYSSNQDAACKTKIMLRERMTRNHWQRRVDLSIQSVEDDTGLPLQYELLMYLPNQDASETLTETYETKMIFLRERKTRSHWQRRGESSLFGNDTSQIQNDSEHRLGCTDSSPLNSSGSSNIIQVQPASMSLVNMQQRTCERALPRSREHFRLPLPGPVCTWKTVVPCEMIPPHRQQLDPNPLSGSPNGC